MIMSLILLTSCLTTQKYTAWRIEKNLLGNDITAQFCVYNNKGEYFVDKTFTFTHLFFSSENNSEERAVNSYKDIIKGFDVNADPFFLGKNFTNKTLTNINSDFGKNFGDYFQNITINEWSEPIESPFGHHLVYVFNKNDGYYPDITKIYKKVEMDLLQDKRDQAVKKFIDEIKSEYKVYINPDLQF